MFIVTTRFTRKKAVCSVILFGTVLAGLIILVSQLTSTETPSQPQLADNPQRVEYLRSLGWEVEPEPLETLQFLLPETLEEPYHSYNELQMEQGFDLSACCGKQVSRFTYTVTNYPEPAENVQANLYVCDGLPVAGDLCCPGAGGFQAPLIQTPDAA